MKGSRDIYSTVLLLFHLLYVCRSFRLRSHLFGGVFARLALPTSVDASAGQLLKGLREINQDPKVAANNIFVDWLADNGVWVSASSGWGRAPHPLVIATNTEDDGESCGRGLLAKEGMSQGELMMTIPMELCLTRSTAQAMLGSSIIDDDMDEYLAIALLLMTERTKGSESRWAAYFSVLPDVQEVYPSYVWTESELDMLQGSPTFAASKSLRAKLEREYAALSVTPLPLLPHRELLTFELFLWAFVMLLSRAARLTSKQGGETLALVPYADLMNHNPYSTTYIDAQAAGMPLISRTEEVAVYADRSYKKFKQVFINYGEKSNADLMLLYGFALDQNPFDAVDITVGLSAKDRLYKQKQEYLLKSGRGAVAVRFPLQQRRYPSELVDFMRLLLVEPHDLGMQTVVNTDFNEPLTPSLERRVLSTLINICSTTLSKYPDSLLQDEALMADKALFATLSRHQRMAVKLRASEKRILTDTIAGLEAELLTLPSALTDTDTYTYTYTGSSDSVGFASKKPTSATSGSPVVSTLGKAIVNAGDKVSTAVQRKGTVQAAGRSFDVLARRTTVQTAKGPADWVEFRNSGKTGGSDSSDSSGSSGGPSDRPTTVPTTVDKRSEADIKLDKDGYVSKSEQRRARRRK